MLLRDFLQVLSTRGLKRVIEMRSREIVYETEGEVASELLKSSLLEACLKEAHSYQKRFKSVESLSSEHFLDRFGTSAESYHDAYVLLDARTAAERKISVIQGAIPVSEFQGDANIVNVVCYCTIGYRSGLEATRIQRQWPNATVYNLDGIIAFSHAITTKSNNSHVKLVNPLTGEMVQTVHTFAALWDYVDPEHFDSIHFPLISLPFRFLQVGARAAVRHSQTLLHTLGCGPKRRTSRENVEQTLEGAPQSTNSP